MIKIAIITERADISLGGAERSVLELAEALTERHLDVHIIAAKGAGHQDVCKVHILCGDRPGKRASFSIYEKALKRFLAENKFDILHSVLPFDFADIYQPRGGSFLEAIERNAASYDNKFLETLKKITAFTNLRRKIYLNAEKRLCNKPDGPIVAALSNYVAEQFVRHYSLTKERIIVIPNGVKTDSKSDAAVIEALRLKLSSAGVKRTERSTLLVFAANNFRLKGLKMLIEAIGQAVNSGESVYLLVAGSGEKRKYERVAKKLGVGKRIIFLGKVDNIRDYIAASDVAALPTFYDPSSRFILEAIAESKPVITTLYNGAAELIKHGRHGIIIDKPDNMKALTGAIMNLSNEDQRRRFSEAIVIDKLNDKISIKRAAEELHRLYEKIMKEKR
jgi:UDP-glucose:(heptosyl)LPS alpha-1,3-glucosyltransferase